VRARLQAKLAAHGREASERHWSVSASSRRVDALPCALPQSERTLPRFQVSHTQKALSSTRSLPNIS